MSSRVGTAMPASFSTALSSACVGLTRSTQTALSGNAARSSTEAFLSEDSFLREDSWGTNTESMGNSGRHAPSQTGIARFWQADDDVALTGCWYLWRAGGLSVA